jgi:hypothetical protein
MLILVSAIDCAKVPAHGSRVLPTQTTVVEESLDLANATYYSIDNDAGCPVDRDRSGGGGRLTTSRAVAS